MINTSPHQAHPFFAEALLDWYPRHRRDLPWRHTQDPYAIWLSEIILQQTRVQQGLPYYERFLAAYPTVHDLAAAPEQEVLRLWQGLGYYSRARNMRITAQQVVNEYAGQFPGSYAGLVKLRGIGPYTAAAIASFAFGERVAVLDGNVYRVLARVFGLTTDIAQPSARKEFQHLADQLISVEEPADYNQAIMEFGAIQCTPTNPDCLFCPVREQCFAFQHGMVQQLPVKSKAKAGRTRYFHYLVLRYGGQVYLRKRTGKDIWHSLYDFYLTETPEAALPPQALVTELEALGAQVATNRVSEPAAALRHALSHQKVEACFHELWLDAPLADDVLKQTGLEAYAAEQMDELPKPVIISNYLNKKGILRN
ncbi:A/G-specific adenine glycosylase [Hymenobacter oligotrophus]|uniref:Adenine DNA glycosylase n=1 Tax=Hymenobacter oligotrophus TaxID=2319843 RepID=A0A3B7R4I3_9BACT|nr:A/G-specific adenine glycosylase [Hymenobacter oligotrophus]AYA38313.1 A/G-specific adenine glycosylase [Hymenobacter oligotrophus]